MKKNKHNRAAKCIILISTLAFMFFISILVDRCVGWASPAKEVGILFPPSFEYVQRSSEFECTVSINSLGFRDREFAVEKPADTIRILAIGDSFTHGWGVQLQEAWPKVLEAQLRQNIQHCEVANLGKPGGHPAFYLRIAEKSIPLLKPDMVILAILQGDDLSQMLQLQNREGKVSVKTEPRGKEKLLTNFLEKLYPNLRRIRLRSRNVTRLWKRHAAKYHLGFTETSRIAFQKIDSKIREDFFNGLINPHLINFACVTPRYFHRTTLVDSPEMQQNIRDLASLLKEVRSLALKHDALLVVTSVPGRCYVSRKGLRQTARLGFYVEPEMLTTNAPDESIRLACELADVPFLTVLDEFRKHPENGIFYFEIDGHFTPQGHEFFAEALAGKVTPYIKYLDERP